MLNWKFNFEFKYFYDVYIIKIFSNFTGYLNYRETIGNTAYLYFSNASNFNLIGGKFTYNKKIKNNDILPKMTDTVWSLLI